MYCPKLVVNKITFQSKAQLPLADRKSNAYNMTLTKFKTYTLQWRIQDFL